MFLLLVFLKNKKFTSYIFNSDPNTRKTDFNTRYGMDNPGFDSLEKATHL